MLTAAVLLPAAGAHATSNVVLLLDSSVPAQARLPAIADPGDVVLPVTGGTKKTLKLAGDVTIAGVAMHDLQVSVPRSVTAKVNGTRRTVLRLSGGRTTSKSGTIGLHKLVMRPAGPLETKLGRARIGTLSASVRLPKPLATFPRPAGAVTVTDATLSWHVRDSLVQYLNAGEGVIPSAGATAGPKTVQPGSDAALDYDFAFTAQPGWRDDAGGKLDLPFKGTLRLRYKDHGIDLTMSNPEVRVSGTKADVVVDFSGVRTVLSTLDLRNGTASAPATLTATGADLLAGFYNPGDPFGAMTFNP